MSRSTNMKYYSTSTLPRNENSRPYTIGAVNNNNNNIMKQTNNFRLIPFHRKSEYSELKVAGKNPLSTPKKNNSRIEKELKGERKKREMSVGDVNDVKDRETEDIKNERKDIKNERKNIKNVIYKEKINNREIVSMNIKGIKRDLNMDNNKDRLERKRSEVEVLIRGIGEQRHNNNNNNIEDIEDIKDPGIRGSAPNASTAHNTSTAHNASTAPNASDAIGIGTSPTPPKPLEREIIRARHELHNRHLEFTSPLYGLYNQPTDTIPIQPSTHTAHKLHINNAQITVIRTLPPPTHPQFSDHSSFPTCIGQQPPLPRNSPHVLYSAEPTSKYMHGGPKWRWDSSVKLGVVGDTPNIYNIQNAHNAHNKHNMDLNKRNQVIVNLYGSSGRRNRTSSGQSMTGRLSTPPHAKLGSPLDPSPIFKCNVSKRYSPTFFPRKSELEVEVEVEEGEERINSLERENINNTNNINTINNNNNIEEQEIITISDPPMGESVSKMTTPLMPRFSSRSDNPLTLTETHPKLLSKALISHQRTNSVSNLRHSTTAANNLFECRKSYNSISKTARNTPSPHSNTLLKIPNNNNNNRFREGSRLIPIIKPKSAAQQRKITAQRKYRYGGGSIDYNHKYTPEDNINAHTNANLNTNANTHIPGNLTGRLSPYERFSNNNSRHGRNFTKYVRSLPTSPLPFFSQKNDNSHLWDMKDEEGLPQYGGPNFCLQLATNNYTPKRKQNEIISDPGITIYIYIYSN